MDPKLNHDGADTRLQAWGSYDAADYAQGRNRGQSPIPMHTARSHTGRGGGMGVSPRSAGALITQSAFAACSLCAMTAPIPENCGIVELWNCEELQGALGFVGLGGVFWDWGQVLKIHFSLPCSFTAARDGAKNEFSRPDPSLTKTPLSCRTYSTAMTNM